jgi:hypothetical protein
VSDWFSERFRGWPVGAQSRGGCIAYVGDAGLCDEVTEKRPRWAVPQTRPRKAERDMSIAHGLIVQHPSAPPAKLIDPAEYFSMHPLDPREQRVVDPYAASPESIRAAKASRHAQWQRDLDNAPDDAARAMYRQRFIEPALAADRSIEGGKRLMDVVAFELFSSKAAMVPPERQLIMSKHLTSMMLELAECVREERGGR